MGRPRRRAQADVEAAAGVARGKTRGEKLRNEVDALLCDTTAETISWTDWLFLTLSGDFSQAERDLLLGRTVTAVSAWAAARNRSPAARTRRPPGEAGEQEAAQHFQMQFVPRGGACSAGRGAAEGSNESSVHGEVAEVSECERRSRAISSSEMSRASARQSRASSSYQPSEGPGAIVGGMSV